MTNNPISALIHSRKFLVMVLDVAVSTILYFVSKYGTPSVADDVRFLIAALQPVMLSVIAGIAYEDAALIHASAVSDAATITAKSVTDSAAVTSKADTAVPTTQNTATLAGG